MADRFAAQTQPSPEVPPWPDGVNRYLDLQSESTVHCTGLTHGAFQRGPSICNRNMERTGARMTRRADGQRKIQVRHRAHEVSRKPYSPNEKIKSFGLCFSFDREGHILAYPLLYARIDRRPGNVGRDREAEKRPAGTFSHV